MSPRTSKQFEKIREQKRKLIHRKALFLFARKGMHATSMNEIAEQAGISKGLIYNYFESKEALIREIVLKGLNTMMQFVDPNRDGVLTRSEMSYMVEEIFGLLQKETQYWKLYFSLFSQPPVLQLISKELNEIAGNLLRILTAYFKEQGYEDPQTEAMLFGSLMDGISINYIYNIKDYPLEKAKERILKIYNLK